jgi:hypothetical protein
VNGAQSSSRCSFATATAPARVSMPSLQIHQDESFAQVGVDALGT